MVDDGSDACAADCADSEAVLQVPYGLFSLIRWKPQFTRCNMLDFMWLVYYMMF